MFEETSLALPQRTHLIFVASALVALTFFTYAASLGNEFFLLDDGLLIFENNAVREISLRTLKAIFTSFDPELYIPLTLFSYQLDYLIGDFNPMIYHLTNIFLHSLNVLLVTLATFLLSRKKFIALFCGAFFAVHPLHVETVAWAAARKDVLSALFFLGAMVSYLYYREHQEQSTIRTKLQMRCYFMSIALFLLGLLSKVTVLTLPVILLLIDVYQKRKWNRALLLDKLPYLALSIVFGIIALSGKADVPDPTTLAEKLLLAAKSTIFSLEKFFLPINLNVFYPQLQEIRLTSLEFLLPFLIILLIATVILIPERLRQKLHVYLPHHTITFSVLFFLITLAPSFLTVSKGGNVFFTSDRYAYLPSIGILFLLGTLLSESRLLQRFSITHVQRITFSCMLLLLFASVTIHQSLLWNGGTSMFKRATVLYPDFYLPFISLSARYRMEGKYEEALTALERAIALHALPNTYGLIGQVHAEQGEYAKALEAMRKGLALNPNDPELHYALAQVYALQGRTDEAFAEYEQTLQLLPEEGNVYQTLSRRIAAGRDRVFLRMGILEGAKGKHDKALSLYDQALAENPFLADAHFNSAVALGNMGRRDEAMEEYYQAIAIDPTHVASRVNLGILLFEKGRLKDARKQFETVLRMDRTNEVAKQGLSRVQQLLR